MLPSDPIDVALLRWLAVLAGLQLALLAAGIAYLLKYV